MGIEKVAFEIPKYIAKGLANGTFVRCGGVVRNASTGVVVKMLKEIPYVATKSSKISSVVFKKIAIPIAGAIGTVGATIIAEHKDDIANYLSNKFTHSKSDKIVWNDNVTDFKSAKKSILKTKKA